MTSNMLAGERRWVSARRGGMTVLGKVAVPKPLNLPSQRLENHGLDPNVEIVPKGTLSWGSRTSSSTSNPWGSSALSPNADGGGASSPSHLRSRPSSGGSGTRPSTAGSDRAQEPTTSAWGTSSRPSSASGPLSSDKVPLTLARPRSAETRPGSSQLSRFAEPVSEHPVAWGATATAERLGVLSSKNEGFSLTSGDFPTLGSDRDTSGKTTESQDHGSSSRPSSASGKVAQPLEKTTAAHSDVKGGSFDAWKRDGQSAEDPPEHGMEKWQGDPHQFHGPNVPPQHFDAWRGPRMNTPSALWYRGPPGGPPYGAPVPPGSFPIDPFPYFPPQMPPPDIAKSHPVPPPGPGSRGHHPRGGDMYRPQIADTYIRPNMPFRPGFYSGPVAFDGYYGPPMGYCNSNEREIPLMGMPPGPPVYNRYSGPKTPPDPSNTNAGIGSHYANTKATPEVLESAHPDDAKGPYRVLLKHDASEEEETWEHATPTNGQYHDRSCQRSLQKHERGGEYGDEKESYSRSTPGSGNCYLRSYGDRGGDCSDTTNANSVEGINTMKVADGSWTKKSGYVESPGGVPPSSLAPEKISAPAVTAKDSSLMQKIEGLNAKVRASDGCYEAPYVSSGEDINKADLNSMAKNSVNEAKGGLMSSERTHTSGTTGNKGGHSIAATSRRPYQGAQTRNDNLGKPKFDSHDDGWRKKPLATDSSAVASGTFLEPASNVHACESGPQVEAVEQALTDISVSGEKESMSDLHDSAEIQAQWTKMKELARLRALQLQKEEEERIKQQRAKALTKLEESNLHMQAGDASCQKAEKDSLADVIKQDLQGSSPPERMMSTIKPQARNATLAAYSDVIDVSGRALDKDSGNINPPVVLEFGTSIMVQSEIAIPQPQAFLTKQDANRVTASHGKDTCQSSDGDVIKHKHTSYKQRPNTAPKNMNEKSVSVSVNEVSKGPNDIINNVPSTEAHEVGLIAESNMVNTAKVVVESSAQPRRKGNRTNKYKQKFDAVLPHPPSPSPVRNDSNPAKVRIQQEKLHSSQLVLDVSSVQAATSDNVVQPAVQSPPLPTEEGQGRLINHWKPQHPRRTQRNQHSNMHTDKFQGGDSVVWAPVKSQSKTEDAAEASQKTGSISIGPLKSDNVVQSNSKSKRAEMERYVPKPVAKELAQHGSSQQPPLSGNSPSPDGTTGRAESRPENSGCSVPTGSATECYSIESTDGDGKHNNNKQGRAHGVWRQRFSTELALDCSKNDGKSLDRTQSLKPDGDFMRYASKCLDEFDVSDGWNMPGDFEGQRTTILVVPDEGTTGKGKRYPSKGHRSTGNSGYEYKSSSVGPQQNHTLSGVTEINQMDRRVAAKENRGVGSRTPPPHWQPKSQMLAVNNQQASVSTGAQNITMEGDRGDKRDYYHDRVGSPICSEKESCDIGTGQADSFSSEDKIVAEVPNVRNVDPRRERKPASFRGRPYSPNQGPVVKAESAPADSAEAVQERSNSGLRRSVNQNNRSAWTQESQGDLFPVKDNQQHNTSSGRERRKNKMHYEYQPVGQYNNSKPSNFEGLADGSQNVDKKRFRERGQVQSKRGGGNFHGRQGGSSGVNASYD
ncbi:unnamed protein product [Withania somnifera]